MRVIILSLDIIGCKRYAPYTTTSYYTVHYPVMFSYSTIDIANDCFLLKKIAYFTNCVKLEKLGNFEDFSQTCGYLVMFLSCRGLKISKLKLFLRHIGFIWHGIYQNLYIMSSIHKGSNRKFVLFFYELTKSIS